MIYKQHISLLKHNNKKQIMIKSDRASFSQIQTQSQNSNQNNDNKCVNNSNAKTIISLSSSKLKKNEENTKKALQRLKLKYQNAKPLNVTGDQGIIEIENDHRRKLKQMKNPFKAIGHLLITFPQNEKGQNTIGWGTGFLIYDYIVLTCAHNVYNKYTQNTAIAVQFVPGLHGKIRSGYSVGFIYIPDQYINGNYEQCKKYDFAMLVLCVSSLANQFGYLGINQGPIKIGEQLIIFGYPKDLNDKNQQKNQEKSQKQIYQYGCSGKAIRCDQHQINYLIDTSGGQSGSPIFRITSKGDYQVVGIHTSDTYQSNRGVKIILSLLYKTNKWAYIEEQTSQKKGSLINSQLIKTFHKKNKRKVKHKCLGQTQSAICIKYDLKYKYIDSTEKEFLIAKQFYDKKEYGKSQFLLFRLLELLKKKFDDINILAMIYKSTQNLQKAQSFFLKSLQLNKKYMNATLNQTIHCQKNLFEKTIIIQGKVNPMYCLLLEPQIYYKLSIIYLLLHKQQLALQYIQKSLRVLKDNLQMNPNQNVYIFTKIFLIQVTLYLRLDRIQDGLIKIEQYLQFVQKFHGQKSIQVYQFLLIQELLFRQKKDIEKSQIYLKKCLKICEYQIQNGETQKFQTKHSFNLARLYERYFKDQKAIKYYKLHLKNFWDIFQQDSFVSISALTRLGALFKRNNKLNKAKMLLQKSYKMCCQKYGIDNRNSIQTISQLGFFYFRSHMFKSASQFLKTSVYLKQKYYGIDCLNCTHDLTALGIICSSQKEEKAKHKKVFSILQNHNRYQLVDLFCLNSLLYLWISATILNQSKKALKLYNRITQFEKKHIKKQDVISRPSITYTLIISYFYFQLHDYEKAIKYLATYQKLIKKEKNYSLSLKRSFLKKQRGCFQCQNQQDFQQVQIKNLKRMKITK